MGSSSFPLLQAFPFCSACCSDEGKKIITFSKSDLSELYPSPATDCSGTSRPGQPNKHQSRVLRRRCTDTPDEMGTQTMALCCCPRSLKSLMEYISSWNVTVLLHVLQKSVSAEILTHSSWNVCKPLLAAARRGYGPQPLTSVQFSGCVVQHTTRKSNQNWPCGSQHWAIQQGFCQNTETPSLKRRTSGFGWLLCNPLQMR